MGTAARVLSGSLAAWARIGVMVVTQVGLVPVFLTHWPVEQYGCWLVIVSVGSFVGIFSYAHHTYVGNEILRVPQRDARAISLLLSAALPFSLALGLAEWLLLGALALSGPAVRLFDLDGLLPPRLTAEATTALLVHCGTTYLSVCISGLYGRVASAFGRFPRAAWWGVGIALANAVATAGLLHRGAGLLQLSIALGLLTLALHLLYLADLWGIARAHRVRLGLPSWRLGWRNLLASFGLGLTCLLGLVRQQGTRVLVSATLGAAPAVVFTTLRTASNLALQGVATVIDPLFPEFMGFLRDRRQGAIDSTFAFIWLLVVFMLGPLLVLLQALGPALFEAWTQGKLPFDAPVFALFSAAMLVFALARPAESIVVGNNLLRVQFVTAASLAGFTVAGIVWLDGRLGMGGVAAVLLAAETASAVTMLVRARRWMAQQGLVWPQGLFRFALLQAAVCVAAMLAIAWVPPWGPAVCSGVLLGTGALMAAFLSRLPEDQRTWLRQRAQRFLPLASRR